MKKVALHWQILIGIILGVLFGTFFGNGVEYIAWIGTFFLNALKMIIVPLIITSIITGVTSIGKGENLGRLGWKTLGYYLTTSLLAVLVGLTLVNIFQPGVGAELGFEDTPDKMLNNDFKWYSIFLSLVHPNLFDAFARNEMLSIITFSLVFGIFTLQAEKKYRDTLKGFFDAAFEVMMKVTLLVIKLTPYGVFAIVAKVVRDAIEQGSLADIVGRLGLYSLVVLLGLATHAFIVLPLLIRYVGKIKNPYKHLRNMATPLLNAFGTASSSATLPLTLEAVEHKSGVSNSITSFTIPLGATVNMDGTALYECVAAMFIAQAYGVDLSFGQQFLVVITALSASIGAAGIPGAGLVMMAVILNAVGLPLEGVGLILAVDRILDMCRTAVNVWSDSCGAVIIASSEGENITLEVDDLSTGVITSPSNDFDEDDKTVLLNR